MISVWEPFIERNRITITNDGRLCKIHIPENLNINISDALIRVMYSAWKSWKDKKKGSYENLQELRKSVTLPIKDLHRNSIHEEPGGMTFTESSSPMKTYFEQAEDGVCPFSVKNETGMQIYLKQQDAHSEGSFAIMNGCKIFLFHILIHNISK